MQALLKLVLSKLAIAKGVTITICALIVAYGGFLFFFHSTSFSGGGMDRQRQALEGKLTIASEDGTICYRTRFDNQSSHILSAEKGACREPSTAQAPRDADGPLGSIRKALNGR
jgi:hypothetical protein